MRHEDLPPVGGKSRIFVKNLKMRSQLRVRRDEPTPSLRSITSLHQAVLAHVGLRLPV